MAWTWWVRGSRWAGTGLVLYGLVVAGVAWRQLERDIPAEISVMGTRVEGMRASIAVLKVGGPPLLGVAGVPPPRESGPWRHLPSHYGPVGTTDDQGMYLYVPMLATALGVDDPVRVQRKMFIVLVLLLCVIYPVVFHRLFDSIAVAVASPWLLLAKTQFMLNSDLYWISAWILLGALPVVWLLAKTWGRAGFWVLGGTMVVASFASSIRLHAGLPVLLAGVLLCALRREWRPWRRVVAAAALGVLYSSVHVAGFEAIRAYRDHVIGDPTLRHRFPTAHPFWHSAYIGLGYLKNPYGIEWLDTVGIEHVHRVNPRAGYLTPEYEAILRRLYFGFIRTDPGFVVENLVSKAKVVFGHVAERFTLAWILGPLALLVGSRRRLMRRWMLLLLPAFVVTLLPAVLTLPSVNYEMGWLGTWALLWLLGVGWAGAEIEHGVVARARPAST